MEKKTGVDGENSKKAILVVSFGTTYAATRKLAIESVEKKIKEAFPNYEIRRAFTSRTVIKKLAERDGLVIDNEIQALDHLQAEGYTKVFVQPLHMVAGEEYEKVKRIVDQYAKAQAFDTITLGRPILFYGGQEHQPDDYAIAIEALRTQLPKLSANEAVVLMGHGGLHPANAAYPALQLKLEDCGLDNVFIYTVEGFPDLDRTIAKLRANKMDKVTLMPFMLVAGDHAVNDMAGDDQDSAKSQLEAAGFTVETYIHGLGENAAVQNIYIQHLTDAIEKAALKLR